tara:strand:- start:2259 stop:2924 length:666 start_codon:yes stop_codon:yes gene_type:complete
MALKIKNLEFKVQEINPGLGQIEIFKLTGQRQLPVIVDGNKIIADSTEICEYINSKNNLHNIYPENEKLLTQALLIEDWADTTFATAAKKALIKAALNNPQLRVALLPEEFPNSIKDLLGNLSLPDPQSLKNMFINDNDQNNLEQNLIKLSNSLEKSNYLIGDHFTIADLAVAAQLSLLKFPESAGSLLKGKGNKEFIMNPYLKRLFEWRDELEEYLEQIN